jgi:ABC-type nitrate/sulfonate/bicarbonate transport system permease component
MGDRAALLTRSIQVFFLLFLLSCWYVVSSLGVAPSFLLPSPARTWSELQRMTVSGELWAAAKVTLVTIAIAFSLAAVVGLTLGFLISRSSFATKFWEPIFAWIFAVPLTLFFPLFILFFGIGPNSKIAYGAVYSFFPVVLSCIAAFSNVERLYIKAADSMGASPWQAFRYIYLPSSMPKVVTGLRLGLFICIAAVLGGETLASLSGIGNAVAKAGELMESSKIYAWLVIVVLATFLLNIVLAPSESDSKAG